MLQPLGLNESNSVYISSHGQYYTHPERPNLDYAKAVKRDKSAPVPLFERIFYMNQMKKVSHVTGERGKL